MIISMNMYLAGGILLGLGCVPDSIPHGIPIRSAIGTCTPGILLSFSHRRDSGTALSHLLRLIF